jgi:hypothetical protein
LCCCKQNSVSKDIEKAKARSTHLEDKVSSPAAIPEELAEQRDN